MSEDNQAGITKKVIGILSGTSADAVDVVLTEIGGSGKGMKVKVLCYNSYPIPLELKGLIYKCASKNPVEVENICKLNFIIGNLFADSILRFIGENNIDKDSVDLIGSHGQTIYHYPEENGFLGYPSKSTLQIGEASVIAKKTGITTVSDFRSADVALGGDGAPLVPYMDYVLFSNSNDRMLVNIGGIANVSYLKSGCSEDEVLAFDCGPGNMLIDALCKRLFDIDFDDRGDIASSSVVDVELFKKILEHDEFISRAFPKSTGREYYGNEYVEFIIKKSWDVSKESVITTVSELTVYGILKAVEQIDDVDKEMEILVSGGGSENKFLMKRLSELFPKCKVVKLDSGGITSQNKEAVLFAILAHETINGVKTNIPSVTGASRKTILGKICPAA